ncbi:MAG: response regulator [Deltaproteobacteria bacterium]|nr:response regulator [Deltaproteobacteria bacterium]MBW2414790.1 response regulator [Deltaproteobacteria bacterium]
MPKTIIIAEDDRSLASSLGRVLEADGYACHYTTDGVSTVEEVKSVKPDLIVLDVLLPKKDGRTVLTEIRAGGCEAPVISMSGVFRGRSTAEEMRDLGAQEFLEKPFTVRFLLDKVLELIGPAEEPDSEAGKTKLGTKPAAEILWDAMEARFTGALQFQREKVHKVLILNRGEPSLIRSNSARECLGRRLLAAGRIDRAALDESLRRCKDDGKRQGEVFVELGVVTQAEIEAELAAQAADKLLGVFNWEQGESWEQSGVTTLNHASPIDSWSPRAIILYGAQRMTTAQIAKALNPRGNVPISRSDVSLDERELAAPGISEFFDALEPGALLGDYLAQHGRAIYGLWLVGALSLGDKSDVPECSDPRHSELTQLRATMQSQTFYEILGVEPDAKSRSIRSAFLELAKTYHPDKFSADLEPVRRAAGEVFTLMSSAHDALTDKDSRREYDAQLKRGASTGKDAGEVVTILRAESLFKDAEALAKRRDYVAAEELLRDAIEMSPEEGEFHALRGWCHFLRNEASKDGRAEALELLERAIQLAPSSTTGYYYKAKLHKACEEAAEAQKMFRKVLDIDPKHQEAMREIRLASMRKKKQGGGLFGFGRKN